jgi:hypothetical protein
MTQLVTESLASFLKEDRSMPTIFTRTIYRLPTHEELFEVNNYQLEADEIVKGFSYTIIGRGMRSPSNVNMIKESIKMLCDLYPENPEYKKALDNIAPPNPKISENINESVNESVEPVVMLRKYGELGDLCFDLLRDKHSLGNNVVENKEEIWKYINDKLDEIEINRKNNTGPNVPDGAFM